MERRFYRDDFEKYLRDQSDQFKMYPDRKVWHSIYNDLYPGKKWPSVTTTLFVLFFLFFVNNFNTGIPSQHLPKQASVNNSIIQPPSASKDHRSSTTIIADQSEKRTTAFDNDNKTTGITNDVRTPEDEGNILVPVKKKYSLSFPHPKKYLFALNTKLHADDQADADNKKKDEEKKDDVQPNDNDIPLVSLQKPGRNRFSWSYFLAPTVNYRTVTNNPAPYSDVYNDPNKDNTETVAMGFEVGSNLNYQVSDKFRFTTGVLLNYSAYDIAASMVHPQEANLILNEEGSPRVVSATSSYGPASTGDSKVTLHNYSFQASIPIGMQYKIAGNDRLSFSAGASVQPFYVISSNAYVLASDKNLYINYPSLMRDFNVNTEFGTYLSFRASKFNWQIGPRFKYQLLSTYNGSSPYSEHLLNYGLRFGISKNK
jgi:hypothetical protein